MFNHNEFIKKVAKMRATQKKYFSVRSTFLLQDAKRMEKIVDEMIAKWQADQPKQVELFDK